MSDVTAALIPVFLVILAGYGLRVSGLVGEKEWPAINHLCYYALFPLLLVKILATAELASAPVLRIAGAMLLAVSAMALLLVLLRRPLQAGLKIDGPAYTSLFQGTTRWHAFAALAIIAALYGNTGLTVASIGLAAMIPVINVYNVTVLSRFGRGGAAPSLTGILRELMRNPFILACVLGVALNLSGINLPAAALSALDLIGRGALGISLLTVGAALRPRHVTGQPAVLASAIVLRLMLMPLFMLASALALGLSGMTLVVMVICAAVPTASASYTLAFKMGGDAELMASIITVHVLAAMATLPLMIALALRLGA